MLKLESRLVGLFVALLLGLGCGNKMTPMLTAPNAASGDATSDPVDKTSPVPAQPAPAATPKHWPKCWLSSRLAVAEAMRLNGHQADETLTDLSLPI